MEGERKCGRDRDRCRADVLLLSRGGRVISSACSNSSEGGVWDASDDLLCG